MPSTFISYRREDSAGYAGRLHEDLEERVGARQVFRDVDTLQAGQDFEAAIHQRLSQCSACVVMIGPGWLKSQTAAGQRRLDQPGDYVVMEIAAALARAEVLVIPLLVGGATMPAPDDLPETIRALARRHAMTVRDETWEADLDRLAGLLKEQPSRRADTSAVVASSSHRSMVLAGLGIAALVVVLAGAWLLHSRSTPVAPVEGGGTASTGAATDAAGPAYAIDIPTSGAEVAFGDLVYSPVAGSVQSRGSTTRVWLRFRVSNEGFHEANLWDASFRLVVGGSVIAPNSGLNEVLEHRSIRQVVVRFDVPSRPAKATLRIVSNEQHADVPLDLTSNGHAAHHDDPDEGDSLSRATLTAVTRTPLPLLDKDNVTTSITHINSRHFANVRRLRMEVEWRNDGRYPLATGDLVLRLELSGQTIAPVSSPSDAVDGGSVHRGDYVFDVPPTTRQAVLKASFRGAMHDVPLTLN